MVAKKNAHILMRLRNGRKVFERIEVIKEEKMKVLTIYSFDKTPFG